jgi:hypothetical protein
MARFIIMRALDPRHQSSQDPFLEDDELPSQARQ